MSTPLDRALIEAKIVRYLLVEGRQCDVTEIRLDGQLTHISSTLVWAALSRLVESGLVATAQVTDTKENGGFLSSISFPVFWVDRASITFERGQPPGEWWPGYLRRAVRKGVQP